MNSSTISTPITDPTLHNVSHTGFSFNGNCIIDSIYISTNEKSDNDILNTSVSILPSWTPDIKFLASMNHTTDASNIFGLTDSVTSWSLYRREFNGDELYKICEVDPSITSWIDYKLEGNKTYEYLLFANSNTQISLPIVCDKFDTDFFYGWFLIGSDADSQDSDTNQSVECYKFDLNLSSDKVVENNSLTMLKNYTSYDVSVIGNRNFKSGSFTSVMIPTYNGKYDFLGKQRWQNMLDDLQTFLHDKSYKYLKNRNGKILKIITEGDSETFSYQFMDDITAGRDNNKNNQPVTVTINYKEIGDVFPIISN
jgi:hypothetical protein